MAIDQTKLKSLTVCLLLFLSTCSSAWSDDVAVAKVDYNKDIAPVLKKYCAGCHNDGDREGDFSLESYASLLKGAGDAPAFLADDPETSLIYRLMTSDGDDQMPPEGESKPTPKEVELVRLWIEQGAKGPSGEEPDRLMLHVPQIAAKTDRRPITAVDWSDDGKHVAVARFATVRIMPAGGDQVIAELKEFPGKVTSVHFCLDGDHLIASSGVTGLGGVASLWNWKSREKIREFKGHRDLMFDAEVSPDGKLLATCSYDRSILLWDLKNGKQVRQLAGHNGAVYDLAFSPDSQTLLSASADATCKVWNVADGQRLDTLGQPLKEQFRVTFSPNGKFIAAGGADNRIRVWRFISKKAPRINPLMYARFAHEGPIVALEYTADGNNLVSISEDRTIKVWETKTYTETQLIEDETEVSMAMAVGTGAKQILLGRLDGQTVLKPISTKRAANVAKTTEMEITPKVIADREMKKLAEMEPNHNAGIAQKIELPAAVTGAISLDGTEVDADCFHFTANAGEEWVFEINAARSKSKLDSIVEILTTDGKPVERLLLQAVRDSYFTFRGKTADQSNDFRLFNWEEMELNQYLYANGEVTRLWLYPRGPDSGFDVYPGTGKRWGYFDTTPLAHALGEPCYIVEPHALGTELIPNGLPTFKVFYKNDDDAHRKLGKDSKLIFTPPKTGDYVVRVRDVRGMDGDNFNYTLTVRPRQEDFSVNLVDKTPTVPAGGAKEIRFSANRMDQFAGPIEVNVSGLPEGYSLSTPVLIQQDQVNAEAVLTATADAKPIDAEAAKMIKLEAKAMVNDQEMKHAIAGFTEVKVDTKPKVRLAIVPALGGAKPVGGEAGGPLEFEIAPGETIMLQVNAERLNHKGEVSFGKEDAGRNLPHGIFVDNIGLNGLLLLQDQDQREFFLTAAPWVPEQSRLFHLRTSSAGGPASQPVLLHVRSKTDQTQEGAE